MMAEPAADEAKLTPPRHHVAHAWVTKEIYELLDQEAQSLRIHPDQLAAELLTVIISQQLVPAVLERA